MAIVSVPSVQPLPLCLQAAPWSVGCMPRKEGGRSLGRCWEQSRGAMGDPIKQMIGAQQPADLAARQVSTETASRTDLVLPTRDQHAVIQTKINKLHLGYCSLSRGQPWLREPGEKTPGRGYTEAFSHKWQHQKEMKLHSRMNKCAESETRTSGSSITYHPFIVRDEVSSTSFKLPSADAPLPLSQCTAAISSWKIRFYLPLTLLETACQSNMVAQTYPA